MTGRIFLWQVIPFQNFWIQGKSLRSRRARSNRVVIIYYDIFLAKSSFADFLWRSLDLEPGLQGLGAPKALMQGLPSLRKFTLWVDSTLKNHLPASGWTLVHPQNGVAHTKDLYSIDRGDDANHESATSRPIEHTITSVEFLEQTH